MEEDKKLQEALENWAQINAETTAEDFIKGLYTSGLPSSSIVDKFSTWLLASIGATAALLITNTDDLVPVIGVSNFKNAIYLLVISSLFGFLSKYRAIQCQASLSVFEEIEKRVTPIVESHAEEEDKIREMAKENKMDVDTSVDLDSIFAEYCKAFPFWMRSYLRKHFLAGLNDRLVAPRNSMNSLFWQGNYVVLQFFTFLAFVFTAIGGLGGI